MIQINNVSEMISEYIRAVIQSKYPNTDTSDVSPVVNIIAAPFTAIAKSMMEFATDIEIRSNLNNYDDISEEDMDEIGLGNYMLARNEGEKAIGTATIKFKSVSDTQNTTIPQGITLTTQSGIAFISTSSVSFTPAEMFQKWNSEDLTYDVDLTVEAENAGSEYNISSGQLTTIFIGFTNYEASVTNNSAMVGGTDKESNEDYSSRILNFLSSRTLETAEGYEQDIRESFSAVKGIYVAGYQDPLMTRDLAESLTINGVTYTDKHIGGKTDIYIRGNDVGTETISLTAKNTLKFALNKLASLVDVTSIIATNVTENSVLASYTTSIDSLGRLIVDVTGETVNEGDEVKFDYDANLDGDETFETAVSDTFTVEAETVILKSPFLSVTSIQNVTLGDSASVYYDVDEDNGKYSLTYTDADLIDTSNEEITFELLAGAADGLVHGDTVEVTYSYNETIYGIGNHYNLSGNRVITRDLLIKSAIPKYVHIGISIKLIEGITASTAVESAISNALADLFDDSGMNSKIDESDIINALYTNENTSVYIDYVNLPLSTFHFTYDSDEVFSTGTHDGSTVQLGSVEYPALQFSVVTYI